jgi:ketosteroid isomerase-like protein
MNGTLKRLAGGLLAGGLYIAGTLQAIAADNAAAQKFAADRMAAFGRGDAAALLAQYTEDAIAITPMGILRGRAEIKGLVDNVIAEFAQPGVKFEFLSQTSEGDIVTFVWKAETAKNVYDFAAETYVLKDGLAAVQTFAAKVTPK